MMNKLVKIEYRRQILLLLHYVCYNCTKLQTYCDGIAPVLNYNQRTYLCNNEDFTSIDIKILPFYNVRFISTDIKRAIYSDR